MDRLTFGVMAVAVFLVSLGIGVAGAASMHNFVTHLSGDEEVGPVDTKAQGQAIFHLSKDGTELEYKLQVANIEGVTQAHIHCGAEGVNGPVVAFLFGPVPEGVDANGRLARGTITDDDVIPRTEAEGCPGGVANFDDLIAQIKAGEAYVNVHTLDNLPGEIRGQLD